MTKTYPEGTRWRVANKMTGVAVMPCASYEEAMSVLWRARHDAKVAGNLFTYRLVRIPPPRPKRSVEERIAAAVRERTEVILTEWQAPLSESKRRPVEQGFADWLRDLRDGKVK